jgi:hypothetical protein
MDSELSTSGGGAKHGRGTLVDSTHVAGVQFDRTHRIGFIDGLAPPRVADVDEDPTVVEAKRALKSSFGAGIGESR